ncbi:MAG: V-type ATP synthase subunit A, partial [Firmicutes bacterium]|nr:V-type ATP synthase subunit A [Bacillota bacterium]
LETARMIREDFLQQNAFMDVDSFTDYDRQKVLLATILEYEDLCRDAIKKGAPVTELFAIPAREAIGRAKSIPHEEAKAAFEQMRADMKAQIEGVVAKGGRNE